MEEFTIKRGGSELAVSYSPAGNRVIVACHPAASGTRDYFLFKHLHRTLPPAGCGVVTFDRRGEGDSTGRPSVGHFDIQADDLLAVCESIDADNVGLWGISQGAWVAAIAATRSTRVKFLVLLASTGVTPADQMRYANAAQLHKSGYREEVIADALDLRRRLEAWIHSPEPDVAPTLQRDLDAASRKPWFRLLYLPSSLPDEAARNEWIEEMDFEPRPIFERVGVPVLLFYGLLDEWSPVSPSVDVWRAVQSEEIEIVLIPEAGHDMTMPNGALAPEYESRMVQWLLSR